MNTEPLPEISVTNFDKLVHFLMFGGLSGGVFFENTAYLKNKISYQRIVWGSFFFPIVFGGLIEIIQEYQSPYRSGDWMDFLYDAIGVLVSLAICFKINTRLKEKR
ncbi:MAG: VanZ family protein [Dysgonamonadaceae bacterium]|jgi:VanZ family protein|nr:VanZ family protein [Dysgonamonadaceae bacterium]